jgi:RHS repeat-associated protein
MAVSLKKSCLYWEGLIAKWQEGIFGEAYYYPFGLVMQGISSRAANITPNKIKHVGKELQSGEFSDGSGLELYDFHARNYDPQIGRWHNLDPLADSTFMLSPYNYVANNPLIFIDPDGREIKPAGEQEQEYYDRIYKNADKKTRANLDRMQKSKVVYNIKFDDVMGKYGREGTVDFSKADKGELTLLIDGEGSEYNKIAALGDELEHGRQFEDGEIGALKGKDGQSGIAAYDQKDEAKSQDAAVAALKSNGFELKGVEADWVNAKTNGTQGDFFTKYSYQFQVPSGTNANTRYAGAAGKTFLKNNPQLESVVYRKNGKTYVVKR